MLKTEIKRHGFFLCRPMKGAIAAGACALLLLFLPVTVMADPLIPANSPSAARPAGVAVDQIKVSLSGKPYEGTPVNIRELTILYSDGYIASPGADQIHFLTGVSGDDNMSQAPILHAGNNDITFEYRGSVYHFSLEAVPNTPATQAALTLQNELAESLYSHTSDSIFVTIRKYRTEESEYLLTHVIINDPSQIQSGLSHDSYGGERERPSDASKRMGWVVGVNGSNFNWGTGKPEYAGVCIKNRKVMDGSRTNGMEICLKEDGTLFSPPGGLSGEDLLAMGVRDSWSCGDTLLIDGGRGVNNGIQSHQYRYPRTAVGMVKPGEYYLITAGSGHYKGGMTYDEVRNVLLDHGCTYGKCMDGGGSSTLVFENCVVNVPAEGIERPVADYLFFSE